MFSPWVGNLYGKPESTLSGTRLMILGESHYTLNDQAVGRTDPDDTKRNVQEWAIENSYRFYTILSRLVTGTERSNWTFAENKHFWESVTFYNFIPVYLKKSGRPSAETWRSGYASLQHVLADVQPEIVIVCGLELWWYVMDAQPGGIAQNSANRDDGRVGTGTGVRIPHPTGSRGASRYTYERCRPLVEKVLTEVKA